eukprot:g2221.t1
MRQKGHVSNTQYLLYLNRAAGRTYRDLGQYPVLPWVLGEYKTSFERVIAATRDPSLLENSLLSNSDLAMRLRPSSSERKRLGGKVNRERKRETHGASRLIVCVLLIACLLVCTSSYWLVTSSEDDGKRESTIARRIPRETRRIKEELSAIFSEYRRSPDRPSTDRVILIKTHKTASATLASIIFRWGARQGKSVCCADRHTQDLRRLRAKHSVFDVFLNHVAFWRKPPTNALPEYLQELRRIIPEGHFVTSVREPVTHYFSFYNYFIRETPRERKYGDIREFVRAKAFDNPLASDFGVQDMSEPEIESFFRDHLRDMVVISQDRFVETAVLMKRRFNWNLEDVLHPTTHHASQGSGSFVRYDGRRVKPTPRLEDVGSSLLLDIRGATKLDAFIYDLLSSELLPEDAAGFLKECDALRRANDLITELCYGFDTRALRLFAHPACEWYVWSDPEYESHFADTWPGDPWEYTETPP